MLDGVEYLTSHEDAVDHAITVATRELWNSEGGLNINKVTTSNCHEAIGSSVK